MYNNIEVIILNELAKRLKTLRKSIDIPQSKIAEMLKTTQTSVNRYENGLSAPPLKTLLWYADFFDVSMDYIFARTDNPQGKLYDNKPKVIEALSKDNKELKKFIDMCFDPNSPINHKLKEVLTDMLRKETE